MIFILVKGDFVVERVDVCTCDEDKRDCSIGSCVRGVPVEGEVYQW